MGSIQLLFTFSFGKYLVTYPKMTKYIFIRDGDICKYQYQYHIDIFFTKISIYRYDIDISLPLKTAYFQFLIKYTVTHVPNDHAFTTWRHRENYVRQKYMHFSIFDQDSLNGKWKRNKSEVWNIESISICKIKYRIVFDI